MDSFEHSFRRQCLDGSRPRTRRGAFYARETRHRRVCRSHSLSLCSSANRQTWSNCRTRSLCCPDVDSRSNRLRSPRLAGTFDRAGLHRKPPQRFSVYLRLTRKTKLASNCPALVQSPRNDTRFARILFPRSWHEASIHISEREEALCIDFPPDRFF